MPKTNLEKCCDSCKDLEILAAHTLCSCHQKTHSKEQTFEEKWLAIDEKTWLERSQHPDPQTVLAFFKTEVSELLREMAQKFQNEHPVDVLDGKTPVETYGYEAEFNNGLKEGMALTKQHFGL